MKSNYTHISIVLDRSGSMSVVASDTIGGFNEFIKAQQKVPGDCTVTLVQFDTQAIETVFDARKIADAPLLTSETYMPRGGTPLYDAVGQTIVTTGEFLKRKPEGERPAKVIFVILTDGLENSSREYDRAKVFEMVRHQREAYQWEFVFIGANQDALAAGEAMNIARGSSIQYAQNKRGTSALYAAFSENVAKVRRGTAAGMSWTEGQRAEQDAAGAPLVKPK